MVKLALLLSYNILRFGFLKLIHYSSFQGSILQRISSQASIKIFSKGKLFLGKNIELAPYSDIQVHEKGILKLGSRVYMNRFSMISCHGNITIGDNCLFGPNVKIFDNNHKFNKINGVSTALTIGNITVGNNCWISSNVILLKGSIIGDNCVIGAGCVIKERIPSNSIVTCSPNLRIRPIN